MKFLSILLLFATVATAAIWSTDGSQADVALKIASAVDGDTVTLPAGTFTWYFGVTVTGKGIEIRGAGGGRVEGSSLSSLAIGTGSKSFTVTSGTVISASGFTVGETITAHYKARAADYMTGTVTSWNGTTLVLNVTSVGGSGTFSAWTFTADGFTRIVHNAGSATLFTLNRDSSAPVILDGFDIVSGTGSGSMVEVNGIASGQLIQLHNMRFSNPGAQRIIHLNLVGGLIGWYLYFDTGFNYAAAVNNNTPGYGIAFKTSSGNSWTTASTMGAADTTGLNNAYFEQCYFAGLTGEAFDFDDNDRSVIRYCVFDNAAGVSHGADTSAFGNRHNELYNNQFIFTDLSTDTANINQWMFYRGGTGVITDNIMPDISSTMWGNKVEVNLTVMNLQRNAGPNPCWGAGTSGGALYHAPRQVGFGYITGVGTDGEGRTNDSVTYVGDVEPVYIWNNTGSPTLGISDYGGSECGTPDTSTNYLHAGRDYYNNGTAKPGYTKYTYPHPLRSGNSSAPVITTNPVSQSIATGANVTFTAAASGVPTPTWQWSKDGSPIVGATSSTYVITGVAGGDAGSYTATATNNLGSATTSAAVLTVTAVPDPATGTPGTPIITGILP